MFGIRIRRAAKAAFRFITTGVAQMTGVIGDGTAGFACIGHDVPPLNSLVAGLAEHEYSKGKSQARQPAAGVISKFFPTHLNQMIFQSQTRDPHPPGKRRAEHQI